MAETLSLSSIRPALAKADDRSVSYVINKILAEYLRNRKLIK
jgi:hypothetical protein